MNLPVDFIKRTSDLLGEEQFAAFCEALSKESPVSIRVNRLKTDAVPEGGHRVYVHEPVVMLDLCAAPGGKSTLARSVLPEGSLLVANEVMRNRVQVLAENVTKWGHPDTVVLNNDPADFAQLGELFDVILTDVPCSGEGMFRKDPVAVEEWSKENVTLCWQRQRRIVSDIWRCLKPGGLLIYSTCTYNREENEDNVAWIAEELGAEMLPVEVQPEWSITGNLAGKKFPVYRFLPHRTEGEGLFMAVLRKSGESEDDVFVPRRRKEKKGKEKAPVLPREVKTWVESSDRYVWTIEENRITAFPAIYRSVYEMLRERMRMVCAGIQVAEIKGKDLIPSHALATGDCLFAERSVCIGGGCSPWLYINKV